MTTEKIYKSPFPDIDTYYGNAAQFVRTGATGKLLDKTIFIDPNTGKGLTPRQLFETTEKIAWVLKNKYKLLNEDVVLYTATSHLYTAAIHHGILSLGGIISPANVMYTAEELSFQADNSTSKYYITSKSLLPKVLEAQKIKKNVKDQNIIIIEQLLEDIKTLGPNDRISPMVLSKEEALDKVAYLCYSSGTSGNPKGVMTTHVNMTSNTQQATVSNSSTFNTDTISVAVLPMTHIFGLTVYVYITIYLGSLTIILESFDLVKFLEAIQNYKANTAIIVPPIFVLLAKHPIVDKYKKSIAENVTHLCSGAAPLSELLANQVRDRLGRQLVIIQGYGLTETSPIAHMTNYILHPDNPGTIGDLTSSCEARLIDEDTGVDAQEGKRGVLWIRGPNIMKGYWRNEKATKETLMPGGWLITGDVAVIRKGLFYIVDRAKELIKSKGHQVAPAELEGILLSHPGVADSAVIGIHVPEEGTELPRAYVVLKPNTDPLDVKTWFDAKVARHKRLWGGLVVIDAIPKSNSGKILRRFLRDRSNVNKTDKIIGYGERAKL